MFKTLSACVIAICAGLLLCAQAPIAGFPPGVGLSRGAIDASGVSIGNPTTILAQVGNFNSGSPTSGTSVDAPVGSLVCVQIGNVTSAATVTNVTDSASNSYSAYVASAAPSTYFTSSLWCSVSTHDLPSGGTFTVTTSSGQYYATAIKETGATSGVDQTVSNQNGDGTSISLTSGSLAQASELALAIMVPNAALTSFNEGSGFNSLTAQYLAYKVTSSAAAVTYAPSWSNTSKWTAALVTIK